jgi:predicted O-methyltransferase YrrM
MVCLGSSSASTPPEPPRRRCAITAVAGGIPSSSVHELTESYVIADPVLRHAMAWGNELGAAPVPPAVGAVLRLLATAASARQVVEVGTGTGASGLWLLAGMHPDGVLTTIDIEPEVQRLARQAFAAAGHAPGRTRIITGDARGVLPRLADGGYDLVFLDGPVEDHPAGVLVAARILRPGGLLVLNRALAGAGRAEDRADDDAPDDPDAMIMRELRHRLRTEPHWSAVLLETGDGLLCAARAGPDSAAV